MLMRIFHQTLFAACTPKARLKRNEERYNQLIKMTGDAGGVIKAQLN